MPWVFSEDAISSTRTHPSATAAAEDGMEHNVHVRLFRSANKAHRGLPGKPVRHEGAGGRRGLPELLALDMPGTPGVNSNNNEARDHNASTPALQRGSRLANETELELERPRIVVYGFDV